MRVSPRIIAAGLLLGLSNGPHDCRAQAVAFTPVPGVIPDGVSLTATPAVSHDRRYVRLTVEPTFSTVTGFSSFPVPAAVGGGGGGLGGGAGGAGAVVGFGTMAGAVDGVGPGHGPSAYDGAQRTGAGSGVGPSSFASSFAQFLDAPTDRPAPPRRAPAKRAAAPAVKRKTTRR